MSTQTKKIKRLKRISSICYFLFIPTGGLSDIPGAFARMALLKEQAKCDEEDFGSMFDSENNDYVNVDYEEIGE